MKECSDPIRRQLLDAKTDGIETSRTRKGDVLLKISVVEHFGGRSVADWYASIVGARWFLWDATILSYDDLIPMIKTRPSLTPSYE